MKKAKKCAWDAKKEEKCNSLYRPISQMVKILSRNGEMTAICFPGTFLNQSDNSRERTASRRITSFPRLPDCESVQLDLDFVNAVFEAEFRLADRFSVQRDLFCFELGQDHFDPGIAGSRDTPVPAFAAEFPAAFCFPVWSFQRTGNVFQTAVGFGGEDQQLPAGLCIIETDAA